MKGNLKSRHMGDSWDAGESDAIKTGMIAWNAVRDLPFSGAPTGHEILGFEKQEN
jgi:hypothetical protein